MGPRKTGEHNAVIVKLIADGAALREQLAALEARVKKLEGERAAKRPIGPPPLPKASTSITPPRPVGRRSVVDISEIAELVDSMPPPPPRSRK